MFRLPILAILLGLCPCLSIGVSTFGFLSIGDWGGAWSPGHKRNVTNIAASMVNWTHKWDTQFVISTGDNFYDYGIRSITDPNITLEFEDIFHQPEFAVPWYLVIGNHGYGLNPHAQVEYTGQDPKQRWNMPALNFVQRVALPNGEHLSLIFFDSIPCVKKYVADDPKGWDPCGPDDATTPPDCVFHDNVLKESCKSNYNWLAARLKENTADWRLLVSHVNVAEASGIEPVGDLLSGQVDMYLNGHSHRLDYYTYKGAGHFMTTGSGCMRNKVPPKYDSTIKVVWAVDDIGFTGHFFNFDTGHLHTHFYDWQGHEIYNISVPKRKAARIPHSQP